MMAEAGEAGVAGGAVGGAAVPEEIPSPAPGGPAGAKASRAPTKCGLCKEVGHNKRSCPKNPKSTTAGPSGLAEGGGAQAKVSAGKAKDTPSQASPAQGAAATPKEKKKKAATTAKGLKQGAADFKTARDEANKQEHIKYKAFHLKTWRELTVVSSPEGELTVYGEKAMPVDTMDERRAVQVAIEDKWWEETIWPDMQAWGKELDETILLAPDQAEAVALYLDEGEEETIESEGGAAVDVPDTDAIRHSAEA